MPRPVLGINLTGPRDQLGIQPTTAGRPRRARPTSQRVPRRHQRRPNVCRSVAQARVIAQLRPVRCHRHIPHLPHQQLARADEGERRPRGDHSSVRCGLSHGDVRTQARRTTDRQQNPGQQAAGAAGAGIGQQHHRRGDDHPVHGKRNQRRRPRRSPTDSASVCMCRNDTTPAITASSTTLAVVVRRIHWSPAKGTAPVTTSPSARRRRPATPRPAT